MRLLTSDYALSKRLLGDEQIPGLELLEWDPHANNARLVEDEIVIETFGCRSKTVSVPRLRVNLEYLSAEGYVERSHGLASPQTDGSTTWFFYPGYTRGTGGLLTEAADAAQPSATRQDSVLAFVYPRAKLGGLAQACSARGWTLLAPEGVVCDQAQTVAWLPQRGFDSLLGSQSFAIVRGEDSLVQAQAAAVPFVWQIYEQTDGAHWTKLEAFFTIYTEGMESGTRALLWSVWQLLNDGQEIAITQWLALLQALPILQAHATAWSQKLAADAHLSARLRQFALSKLQS